jgi:hypothetical protein
MIAMPITAFADNLTSQAPATAPAGGSPNQFDLDHHRAYTWRIDNVNLGGMTVTGAKLTFTNISNWDTNPNMLFIHLLDTAKNSGVRYFTDATGTPVPSAQIADNFAGTLYDSNPLVNPGTANTLLTQRSFTTTPTTFVYTFTSQQLADLNTYLQNGNNVAFGFDPDCHFWNNGITFNVTTERSTVPEPTSMVLLGTGIAGIYMRRRRQKAGEKTEA